MAEQSEPFIVVGGGVYGAAVALELAAAGAGVVLLEADAVAAGSSGGVGLRGVRANGRDPRELPLMVRAYERWGSLEADLGAPTGFRHIGHLHLYEREHDVGAAGARALVQEAHGVPTAHLTGEAAREVEPGLSPDVRGALHCPRDGVADHTGTTRAYADAARRAGATVREGARVASLARRGDSVDRVVLDTGERIAVGRGLLVAANAGTAPLVEPLLGRRLPAWWVLPQALVTSPAPRPPIRSLLGHEHRRLAMKGLPDGRVMVSGGWRGRWVGGEGVPVPGRVEGNWATAQAVVPALAGLEVMEAWTDRPETRTVDGIPFVDRIAGTRNAWAALGWCGHGWALAPALAPLLARWILDGADGPPDLLAPFAFRRVPGF